MPPTSSHRISRPSASAQGRGALLIAAVSGRALARAAVDAGFVPLVADFFADADTQELAHACRKMPGAIGRGFEWRSLEPALAALAKEAPAPIVGLVYGSGFEDRAHLLTRIAERRPLLGNDAATVERINAPEQFFPLLDRLAIPHPATTMERPPKAAGWVAKRHGGAGGSHVIPIGLQKEAAGLYYQALVAGRSVSALFVANGRTAHILGFSEQWTAPIPGRQWRYGGAVQPATLPHEAAAAMTDAVMQLASVCELRGLASADFVLTETQPLLLEINPRPGATLDIFANAADPLLAIHLAAVRDGTLPGKPLGSPPPGACASAIVYAPEGLIVPRSMVWPDWVADRPRPGERIDKQRPICTLLARAGSAACAKRLVETREASLLAKIQKQEFGLGGGYL